MVIDFFRAERALLWALVTLESAAWVTQESAALVMAAMNAALVMAERWVRAEHFHEATKEHHVVMLGHFSA